MSLRAASAAVKFVRRASRLPRPTVHGLIEATRAVVGLHLAVVLLRCLPLRTVLAAARMLKAMTWRRNALEPVERAVGAGLGRFLVPRPCHMS